MNIKHQILFFTPFFCSIILGGLIFGIVFNIIKFSNLVTQYYVPIILATENLSEATAHLQTALKNSDTVIDENELSMQHFFSAFSQFKKFTQEKHPVKFEFSDKELTNQIKFVIKLLRQNKIKELKSQLNQLKAKTEVHHSMHLAEVISDKKSIQRLSYFITFLAVLIICLGAVSTLRELRFKKIQKKEIVERNRIQQELLISKKKAESANQAKTEFLANISHELRNPMHHILSYSKFGVEKFDTTTEEKRWHYFKQIRKSADRLMVLLNNLLDLSKMESGKMDYQLKEYDLINIIDEAVSELTPSLEVKQLLIELENEKAIDNVLCDSYKIGQVVRNLLSNTIKFSPEGQKIRINIVNNTILKDGRKFPSVQVSIIDQGVGIPEDELESVFDKFAQSSQTKTGAGGTGLGLTICKEIIKAHQGKIWAENNPEGGATFSFILPYEQEVTSV